MPSDSWMPIVALVVGYLLKPVSDWITGALTERQRRQAEREAFRLQTVSSIQAEMIECAKAVRASFGEAFTVDAAGRMRTAREHEGVLATLSVRLQEEATRTQLNEFREVVRAAQEIASADALARLDAAFESANDALRRYFEDH